MTSGNIICKEYYIDFSFLPNNSVEEYSFFWRKLIFLKCLAIILLRLFISSKNPFNILTFMASEAVIYDSMI